MILKQVVESVSAARRSIFERVRPVLRPLVAFRVAAAVLAYPEAATAQSAPPVSARSTTPATLSVPVARAVEADMATVFRAQSPSGAYALPDPRRGYAAHPLFATMSLDAYRATRNTAALSQAAYSIARYYGYLFADADRDGDLLVETRTPWGDAGVLAEDPGFNALLAVDAASLARANLVLRRKMAALYWYDGSRAIARSVVAGTFDSEALYFFPADPASGTPMRHVGALSALPAAFDAFVGPNHRAAIVERHVIPWSRDATRGPARGSDTAARCMERLVAVDVLLSDRRVDAVAALRATDVLAGAPADVISLYATERAVMGAPLLDRELPLDLFFMIVRGSGAFSDADIVRLGTGIEDVKALAFGKRLPTLDAGEHGVRAVYSSVSQLRQRMRSSAFWNGEDRRAFPGPDATIATQRLVEDVLAVARRAENRLFEMRFGAAGLSVRTDLSSNDVSEGERVSLRWQISSTKPLELASLQAGVLGEAVGPVGSGNVKLTPGEDPMRFVTGHVAKSGAGRLNLITYMITVENATGLRGRYFVDRSAYVNPPVAIEARFPKGRAFESGNVPIELSATRHSRASSTAQYFWFSPSGLSLVEGNRGEIDFSAGGSASTTLHVEIPSPCRPGVFPFTLKFYSGNRDAGTIASSLFKPYQWAILGPFPAESGLDGKLPPEIGVALLETYAGTRGSIAWRPVPAASCGPRGEVFMRDLVSERGVNYLYTVIGCGYETDIEVRLAADCPAALFVNGRRVTRVSSRGDSASTVVHLNADKNNILIKAVGDASSVVSFALGNGDNLATDEFSNDLAELAGGYRELIVREQSRSDPRHETHRLVTLRYEDAAAASVAVIGSFNGWSPENHRLQKRGDRLWEITLSLSPGRYGYRFLVDQKRQVLDPSTPLSEPDGFGGKNSVLIVSR